jgi:biopolymer transport protein ExbB
MEFITKIGLAFEHGGLWMWPIAMFQVLSIAIIIERVVVLYMKRQAGEIVAVTAFEDNIRRGEIDAVVAKAMNVREKHPVARAMIAGAQASARFGGKDEIQGKMDEVLLHENAVLDKRIGFLAMLGNVATLTGLLAQGISEAMNCTAYGLIVAIPALLMYALLMNRANNLADDLNQAALKAFNWLSFAYDPVALRVPNDKRGSKSEQREINA